MAKAATKRQTKPAAKGKAARGKAAPKRGKAAPKGKAAAKKAPKKSNIPAITRPRGLTQESFERYMSSATANAEYRLNELETMHSEGRCPHKAVQHLRSVLKEYAYITKRVTPLTKKKRKQVDKSNNILMKKVDVSPELAKFLKLKKGEQVSRSEVNTAVTMYINIKDLKAVPPAKKKWIARMNPRGERSLQDEDNGSIIHPDKALSTLLKYPAYQKRVNAGKHVWHRKDKETKEPLDVVEDNDQLTYSVVQHLLAPHFPKKKAASAPVEATESSESSDESEIDSDEESS